MLLSGCKNAANSAGALIDGDSIGKPMNGIESAWVPGDKGAALTVLHNDDNIESQDFEDENKTDGLRAESLKTLIEKLPGVETATVAVSGDAAVIGVVFIGEPDGKEIVALKKSVKEAALASDSRLTRAAVTAAPELFKRVTNVKSK